MFKNCLEGFVSMNFTDLGYAKPDHLRSSVQGVGEVIYGAGKTSLQIVGIARALLEQGQSLVLATRVSPDKAQEIDELWHEACVQSPVCATKSLTYFSEASFFRIGDNLPADGLGSVVVACAGTSDLYCAEEAALTAEALGNDVCRLYDVGVAGIHRVLAHQDELTRARVVIVVACMEGALASVIGGLVSAPVIAVPTSVGYGASFGGVAALLAMLNSCASGVSVVNIDNGFGAAYQAHLINHLHLAAEGSSEK